jgi:CBS domain-containing protein
MINYLTQLLGKPAIEPDGKKVARILDVIASQGGRLPTVSAAFLKSGSREGWISLDAAVVEEDGIRLSAAWDALPVYEPTERDLRLQRDILDKQIVDVHDYRVVRVNDVRLASCGEQMCVVGADASLRAIVRRAGLGGPVEALAKLIGKPLQSNLIAWDDVETLEPGSAGGGRIKLKVPHEKIARLHPADIADIIEQLDPQQQHEVLEALDVETAADTIEEMEDAEAAAVMKTMDEERAADILDEMEPDEAADLLGDLPDRKSEDLLEQMEPEEAEDVKELLAYHERTAGGLMTTEFIAITARMTCKETIKHLRKLSPKAETIYYVYVVDDDHRLAGVISLRDLIVSAPSTPIGDIMVQHIRSVHTGDNIDEIARVINKYNLLALPVVDETEKLVGIVMVDDVMDQLVGPEKKRRLPQLTLEDE